MNTTEGYRMAELSSTQGWPGRVFREMNRVKTPFLVNQSALPQVLNDALNGKGTPAVWEFLPH